MKRIRKVILIEDLFRFYKVQSKSTTEVLMEDHCSESVTSQMRSKANVMVEIDFCSHLIDFDLSSFWLAIMLCVESLIVMYLKEYQEYTKILCFNNN